MMNRILILLTILTISAKAQDPRYGVVLNYGIDSHIANFGSLPDFPSCCPGYKDGSGSTFAFGFLYQHPINNKLLIDTRLSVNMSSAELKRSENVLVNVGGVETLGSFEHILEPSLMNSTLQVGVAYNLFKELFVNAGIGYGMNISGTNDQREELVNPSNTGEFVDDNGNGIGRTRNSLSGDLTELSSSILSLNFGASYDLPLNSENTMFLSPEVSYNLGLTEQVTNTEWTINSLRLGLAIKYSPKRPIEIYREIEKIDTLERTKDYIKEEYIVIGAPIITRKEEKVGDSIITTQSMNRVDTLFLKGLEPVIDYAHQKEPLYSLESKFELKSYDENGKELVTDKAEMTVELAREIYPLLPYIFFDENSSVIPGRYKELKPGELFEPSLLKPSPIVYHRNNLNIIGRRMKANPDSKITLTGYVDPSTEEGKCELAYDRALSVKAYLQRFFDISDDRITIKKSNTCYPKELTRTQSAAGYAENRRVEISSNRPKLLFAVSRTWLQEPTSISPENFKMIANSKIIESFKGDETEYPPKSWTMKIKNGSKEIFSKSGQTQKASVPFKISRNNAKELNNGDVLKFEYNVIGENDTRSLSKEISIVKDTAEFEVEKLTLTVFKVSQATLDRRIKNEIKDFVKNLDDASEVSVIGFSDNLGDAGQNKMLSQVRADAVKNYIKSISPRARFGKVIGVGSEDFPPGVYSFDYPEERFISRTVEIEIRRKR